MSTTNVNTAASMKRLLPGLAAAALWLAGAAQAAVPGITGDAVTGSTSTFNLTASAAYLSEPDGQTVYSWGYGCTPGSSPVFVPATLTTTPFCTNMQTP